MKLSILLVCCLFLFPGRPDPLYAGSVDPPKSQGAQKKSTTAPPGMQPSGNQHKACWESLFDDLVDVRTKADKSWYAPRIEAEYDSKIKMKGKIKTKIKGSNGDILEERVIQEFGKAFAGRRWTDASQHLMRFQDYLLHLTKGGYSRWDHLFAEYFEHLFEDPQYTECREAGVKVLLNPALLFPSRMRATKS